MSHQSKKVVINRDSMISYLNSSDLFTEGEWVSCFLIKDYPEYYIIVTDECLTFSRLIPSIKFLKVNYEHLYNDTLEIYVLDCLKEIEDIYYFSHALYYKMCMLSEENCPLLSLERCNDGQYRLHSNISRLLNGKCYLKCSLSLTGNNFSSASLHWYLDYEYEYNSFPNRETLRNVYVRARTKEIDLEIIPDPDNSDNGVIRLMNETVCFTNTGDSYYTFLKENSVLLDIFSTRKELSRTLILPY